MTRAISLAWNYLICAAVGSCFLTGANTARAQTAPPAPEISPEQTQLFNEQVQPFLKKYCNDCHSGDSAPAGIPLDEYQTVASLAAFRDHWDKAAHNVKSHLMPPIDSDQPTVEESTAFVAWVEAEVARIDCSLKQPGRVTIRRLNRVEYNNTVRDLVGIDFAPAEDFPSDDVGYGFDNIGDVLSMPSIMLEKYLKAAQRISEAAIRTPESLTPPSVVWNAEQVEVSGAAKRNGDRWTMVSSGEVFTCHDFAKPDEYILRIEAFGHQAGDEPAKMGLRVEGKDEHVIEVPAVESSPGTYEWKFRAGGGKKRVGVAFLNDFYNENGPPNNRDRNLLITKIELVGPAQFDPPPAPEIHQRIIIKTPGALDDWSATAHTVLKPLAARAFRRQVTKDEMQRLVTLTEMVRDDGGSFESAIQVALQAILVSPHFLFRVELDPKDAVAGQAYPINEFELASRMSYFLWSSMPDQELFRLANLGQLRDNLSTQLQRMIMDPKADALVENFAGQWLQLRNLRTVSPDAKQFPDFNDDLRQAMRRETELFFAALLRENRSTLELIDADFTFLNEQLAKHYGIAGVEGAEFKRVHLEGDQRGGVLSHASILTVTSNPTRTSPVKRGKWVLEQLLGTPPPPAPPAVPELKVEKPGELSGSLRQRMEQHRADPACATCHVRMDPLGFGLENYDAVGTWRDKEENFEIDASGLLPGGKSFRGPKELKAILKEHQDDFARCLTEKMLTYALGRGIEPYDRCNVDAITAELAKGDYRFWTLMEQIIRSEPFQMRTAKGPDVAPAN